jgi:hypothetical protein
MHGKVSPASFIAFIVVVAGWMMVTKKVEQILRPKSNKRRG